jgi:hypothetical protein
MSTIVGGNADRPQNIHTFAAIADTTGSSPSIECDGTVITTFEKITGGQITYYLQGSMNGTDWADLDDEKQKNAGNYIHTYHGYALRYLRLNVTASGAGRSITMTVCCDT